MKYFELQKHSRPSASAQQDTQRLIRFGHEQRLKLLEPGPALPAADRARIHRECQRSLEVGFNVLLVGLGSKHSLVQDLTRTVLTQYACVTIDGYASLFSARYLLTTIAERLLHVQLRSRHVDVQVQELIDAFERRRTVHIYLVIQQIDGPRFRNAKIQSVFSRLAQCRYIHIVATADHVRTRLLWDSAAITGLAFHTIQAQTLQSYLHESANPTLNRRKGKRANTASDPDGIRIQASAIDSIWASLAPRQREALSNLAFSQITCDDAGLRFHDWMELCHATSDRDFRVLLAELSFHKIVEAVEDPDTSVIFYKIPFSHDVIEMKILAHGQVSCT